MESTGGSELHGDWESAEINSFGNREEVVER